uniref:Dynein light chain n=1 Tax=Phascolarctos cinereus TaxID=38626 RepID=A0A6P5IS87_PHACI|nr:dynein light chain 1, cytoplasmic-like [Phascolarctos cinereus]
MCDYKGIIKYPDISEKSQDSVECTTQPMEKYIIENNTAAHIKKLDKKYHPILHCIIRKNFHICVKYETQPSIYFYQGQVIILPSKSD